VVSKTVDKFSKKGRFSVSRGSSDFVGINFIAPFPEAKIKE